ncbi:2-oxoglutarate dehydrogenase E1 component (EC 1.2.4.2) [Mycetohabitans rhizoxinica HKI 454]|uniref:2-oxoglutarate dehydrogenase E1 component n=1 Tax=Mycetohabitans rhizoxinica (strain DSM 19002 / CIP 109453 / HKI 454) TaxID=882378 RepID=E5AQU5_MYCRK|nr:2-oxoglutarate dehydrogenase E1 component (EC 1.2.4.2) [Mycetohabitans rhizoxinica HKI 454]
MSVKMMKQFQLNSYLFGGNAPYVEELYEAYLDNPASVPENWRSYFDALQNVPASDGSSANDVAHAPIVESLRPTGQSECIHSTWRQQRPVHGAKASLRSIADRRLSLPRLAMGQHRSPEAPRTSAYSRA